MFSYKRNLLRLPCNALVAITLACGLSSWAAPSSAWNLGPFSAKHLPGVSRDQVAAPVALPGGRGFSACTHLFPQQAPLNVASVDAAWKPIALCSNHFAVLYSGLSKTPLVVVERLSRKQMADAKDEQRTEQFFPDPRLPAGARAELSDFSGSGLDRGHLAPAGDQPNAESMAQSFALSNMIPQDPTNNRKIWSKVEKDVRKFARRAEGAVFVFSGPIFAGQRRSIGANRVWVPSAMFKLVYDEASGRSWAYILPNSAEARIEAPMGYQAFVKATGWKLLSAVSQ